jgi:hypothetical protein
MMGEEEMILQVIEQVMLRTDKTSIDKIDEIYDILREYYND